MDPCNCDCHTYYQLCSIMYLVNILMIVNFLISNLSKRQLIYQQTPNIYEYDSESDVDDTHFTNEKKDISSLFDFDFNSI